MLTKKQLKDAARCCGGLCELCSCNKTRMAYQDCIREAAKTALAYREMLERARKTLQDAWDDDGSATVGKQILETIKAIDELLCGKN